jgi:hypothetical protein
MLLYLKIKNNKNNTKLNIKNFLILKMKKNFYKKNKVYNRFIFTKKK